jgi:hypothetical protein
MAHLAILSWLIGAFFGMRGWRVLVLLPTGVALIACAGLSDAVRFESLWTMMSSCVVGLSCLQFGYLLGLAALSIVEIAADDPRRTESTERPTAEILSQRPF